MRDGFIFVVAQQKKLVSISARNLIMFCGKYKYENMDVYARFKSEIYVITLIGGHSTCIILRVTYNRVWVLLVQSFTRMGLIGLKGNQVPMTFPPICEG